jgi:hypothetical protein
MLTDYFGNKIHPLPTFHSPKMIFLLYFLLSSIPPDTL